MSKESTGKTTAEKASYAEMRAQALEIHHATDGAPVEIKDGTRVAKIGPWIAGGKMKWSTWPWKPFAG